MSSSLGLPLVLLSHLFFLDNFFFFFKFHELHSLVFQVAFMSNKLLNACLSKYFYCVLMSFYRTSDSECMDFFVLLFPPHHFCNSHFS